MIRVLLADNQELTNFAMCALLNVQADIELLAVTSSFQELQVLNQQHKPDLIISELVLKDGEMASYIEYLMQEQALILVLTSSKDREAHLIAVKLGAIGIVNKEQSIDIILKAISTVSAGEPWIDRSVTQELWRNYRQPEAKTSSIETEVPGNNGTKSTLSEREFEIACLAARGLTSKKIALQLCLSDKTIRNKLAVIYGKLDVINQLELVLTADTHGLNKSKFS